MTLRFSLLGLIGLTTHAALACAALVQPGVGWTSVIVTLTVLTAAWHVLRLLLAPGQPRAAAVGWLLFAGVYLAIVLGPWTCTNLGPQLVTSKGLNYAQVHWRKEEPAGGLADYQRQINLHLLGVPDVTSNTLWVDSGTVLTSLAASPGGVYVSEPAANFFQLSGHWLCAWMLGWLGAALAAHFHRRPLPARADLASVER
jgi:hypothetical protein